MGKVVTGTAKTRKSDAARKFANIFAPEDIDSVKRYILMDVIVPGIKNAIADVVSVMLYGETRRIGGKKSSGSYVSYQKCYDGKRDGRSDYGRPRSAAGFEYDNIIFETRGDADMVLDQLESAIDMYGVVSVLDLYDLAGVGNPPYTADKYGWTDIHNAKAIRIRDGYILQLPKTDRIN